MGGNTYNRRHFTDEEYFRQKTELINLEEFDINTQRKLRNLLS